MKKIYIKPALELVDIGESYIMAASEKLATNGANDSTFSNETYIEKLTQNIVLEKLQMVIAIEDVEIYSDSTLCNDLGFDDLDMVNLVMSLEKTLNIFIEDSFYSNSDDAMNRQLTVQSIIDYCTDKVKKALSRTYIDKLTRTVVIETLQILTGIEEDDEIRPDNNLCNDLGFDGLDLMEFIMSLEKTLDISIEDSFYSNSDDTIKEQLSVQSVINYCASKVKNALNNI